MDSNCIYKLYRNNCTSIYQLIIIGYATVLFGLDRLFFSFLILIIYVMYAICVIILLVVLSALFPVKDGGWKYVKW
jgi:uncharacterized membrane protein